MNVKRCQPDGDRPLRDPPAQGARPRSPRPNPCRGWNPAGRPCSTLWRISKICVPPGCRSGVWLWQTALPLCASRGPRSWSEPAVDLKVACQDGDGGSSPAAVRKAEREIAEFRDYQRLGKELVEVKEKICRLRLVEETLTPEEQKRRKPSTRKSHAWKRTSISLLPDRRDRSWRAP